MKIKLSKYKKDIYTTLIAIPVFVISMLAAEFMYRLILHQPRDLSTIIWGPSADKFDILLLIYASTYQLFLKKKSTRYYVLYLVGFFVLATVLSVISAYMQK